MILYTIKNLEICISRFLEVPPGFEPGLEVLQTFALPLGYGTMYYIVCFPLKENDSKGI